MFECITYKFIREKLVQLDQKVKKEKPVFKVLLEREAFLDQKDLKVNPDHKVFQGHQVNRVLKVTKGKGVKMVMMASKEKLDHRENKDYGEKLVRWVHQVDQYVQKFNLFTHINE